MKKGTKINKNTTKNIKFTGKMKIYMQWSLWLTLLLVLATVAMFTISVKAGIFMSVVVVVYFCVAWMLCGGSQNDIFGELCNSVWADSEKAFA